jgi:hypothetical protein
MKIFIIALFLTLSAQGGTMMPQLSNVDKVKYIFKNLNKDNLQLIEEFYDKDVKFIDPIGEIIGSQKIKKYYENMYKNVKVIRFEFSETLEENQTVVAFWSMYLETEKLNSGKGFTIEGNSIIRFNPEGKAVYHRDYFDLGAFIYERIPVLGFVIEKIKKNLEAPTDH